MIWDLAQGMIAASQGFFPPQTVVTIINEIDRILSQYYLEKNRQEFQLASEKVRQKFNRELEEYRQLGEMVRLERRLQHEQRLEEYRRESQLILSRVQLLNARELADDQEIRESFPLKTPASVILNAYQGYQNNYRNIPLLVIISPPALEFEKFPNAAQGFSRIESRLINDVQEFCKYYSLKNQERPVRYQGADWKSKSFHSKSAMDVLHHVLQSIPTLVLESKIDGDLLQIYLAGWDRLETDAHYGKVLTIPWKEVLYPIARQYAEKWREYRRILLDKGKSLEEIQRKGGDDELNLLILEEEEEDREFGFTGDRDYKYNVKEEKYIQELAQFLGICHCILVGLLADRYHFCYSDVRPKLPELLPSLLEKVPSEDLKQMLVGEIVSSYQNLYQLVGSDRPYLIANLYLDLAQNLSHLPDQSWARKQIEYSIQVWLQLRSKVSYVEAQKMSFFALLEAFKSALTVEDKEYVEKLSECLAAVGESQHQKMISEEMQRKEAEYKDQQEAEYQRQLEEAKRQQELKEAERKRKLENASVVYTLNSQSNSFFSLAISPDGQTLVSGSRDNTIKIWQLSTGKELRTLTGHSSWVDSLAISPNGEIIVSGSRDNRIKIWQLSTGKELRTLIGHSNWVRSLAISPDGQILVSGSDDNTIKIWQLSTGKELRTLTGHSRWVYSVAISPDGQTLVSGSRDDTIKIWELSTGRELRTLIGHSDSVCSLAISPDGEIIVSGSADKTIKIWELSTGQELHTLTGHSFGVSSVAISPDGRIFVSGSRDNTIKIWQLREGKKLRTLTEHSYWVDSLTISPDGQTLVSGSRDKTIKIWRVV